MADARPWRCGCGRTLGVQTGGVLRCHLSSLVGVVLGKRGVAWLYCLCGVQTRVFQRSSLVQCASMSPTTLSETGQPVPAQ